MTPPGPVKKVIKKMAAKVGHIDFMFLTPPPTQPLDPLLYLPRITTSTESLQVTFTNSDLISQWPCGFEFYFQAEYPNVFEFL